MTKRRAPSVSKDRVKVQSLRQLKEICQYPDPKEFILVDEAAEFGKSIQYMSGEKKPWMIVSHQVGLKRLQHIELRTDVELLTQTDIGKALRLGNFFFQP